MKTIFILAQLLMGIVHSTALAHPEHDSYEINGKSASNIALRTIKQLTKKDLGFDISGLDDSWNSISNDSVSVTGYKPDHYVIKAKSKDESQTIYLKVLKTGQVIQVSDTPEF